MKMYLDQRTLVVKEYDSTFESGHLDKVTVFDFPAGDNVDLDEISKKISDVTQKQMTDGFRVKDTKHQFECGASVFEQEVIFEIIKGIAEGSAIFVLREFFMWVKNKIKIRHHKPSEAFVPKIKIIISTHFKASRRLQMVRLKKKSGKYQYRLKDEKGSIFQADVEANGKEIMVQKLKSRHLSKQTGMKK